MNSRDTSSKNNFRTISNDLVIQETAACILGILDVLTAVSIL